MHEEVTRRATYPFSTVRDFYEFILLDKRRLTPPATLLAFRPCVTFDSRIVLQIQDNGCNTVKWNRPAMTFHMDVQLMNGHDAKHTAVRHSRYAVTEVQYTGILCSSAL